MISWIQQTFQHHFRTMFLVLLAVIIVSFVFVIGASPGIGQGERGALKKEFFGLNLASQADINRLHGDAQVSVELQYGFPVGGDQLQQFAFIRQASLHLADKLHVPPATNAEIIEALKKMRMFVGENGQFDQKRYDDFRKNLQKSAQSDFGSSRLTEADILRVVADNIRVERVQKLLAGPGFALPVDVKRELAVADTSWTLAIAKLDRASYSPNLNPGETELKKFFEDNAFRFMLPRRVVVSYAEFPAAAYASQVKYTESDLRAYFDLNAMRFAPTAAEGKTPVAPEFNSVRSQVEKAFVSERAQRFALEAADQLSLQLFNNKLAPGNPHFDLALSQARVTAQELAPFAENEAPAALASNPQIAPAVFRLNADHPISDAFPTDRGAVVVFYRDSIAPMQPAFADVRKQVTAEYTENEKTKRFIAAGGLVRGAVQAKLKAGVPFETAVVDAARDQGIKAEVIKPAPFTLRQPPPEVEPAIYQALLNLQKGGVSEMLSTAESGLLVHAADTKVPDLSDANPAYAETKKRISASVAASNASDYLEDMITRELAKGEQATR
ncbi:MAG: peptidyl-prolyl cis-trans isomerase [Opitutaceae bacterium]|nr:peptidyl-prolyl cis-trans isomerase [Opitutaceae bacterium]